MKIGGKAELRSEPEAKGRKQILIGFGRSDHEIEERKERIGKKQAEQEGAHPPRSQVPAPLHNDAAAGERHLHVAVPPRRFVMTVNR
jgi:hypothetical protein